MTVLIILICIVLAFTVVIAILVGKRDNTKYINDKNLTDKVDVIFEKEDSIKDEEIL